MQILQGWRPLTEATADRRVDDRHDRRQPQDALFAKSDAGVPPFFFPSTTDAAVHLAWGPEDEAFRAELVAFLDEHAPPETRIAARLRRGRSTARISSRSGRATGRRRSSTTAG